MTTLYQTGKLLRDLYFGRLILMQRHEPKVRWLARLPGFVIVTVLSGIAMLLDFSMGMMVMTTAWSAQAVVAAHEEYMINRYEFTGGDDDPVL